MNRKVVTILIFYFFLQLFLSQFNELQSDEGTHALISIFYNGIIKNAINFHSIDAIKTYTFDFVLKYPKISPYYPPLYHLLLAATFFINKSVFVLRVFNILITILTGLVIFEVGKEFELKENGALIGLIFFLIFSTIFHYADIVMIDILQILTFTLGLLYYIKIGGKKKLDSKNIFILGILLVLAFSTKFYSIFLPVIMLVDAIFNNRKIIMSLILSMLISLAILSPYLYFYFKFNIYKLTISLSNTPFKSNWVYFDIFSNFGIFAGFFVAISIIWFLYKNRKNVLVLSWFFIPLIVLLYLNNKDFRFAFILIPLFSVSCGSFFNYLNEIKWKKLALIVLLIIISSQLIYDVYLKLQGSGYIADKVIKSIEKNDNILITSEVPIHSAVYMFYGDLYNVSGNFIRPCVLAKKNITKDFLDGWGIRYIIEQNNTLNDTNIASLNLNLIEKIENKGIRLFEYKAEAGVDCNFICLLNGKICRGDGFSKILNLINNRVKVED
jgi:hypothetical protein